MDSLDVFPLKEEYSKIGELGRGTYGIVSLWRRKESLQTENNRPKYVAVKSILHSESEWVAKARQREVYILKAVQAGLHNNIVKYYGSFSDNSLTTEQTVLVMEACHGDLRKLIQSKRVLNEEELRLLGEQVLSGLHYLHSLEQTSVILHR